VSQHCGDTFKDAEILPRREAAIRTLPLGRYVTNARLVPRHQANFDQSFSTMIPQIYQDCTGRLTASITWYRSAMMRGQKSLV